jgi:uroporphyrinogen-III synthase
MRLILTRPQREALEWVAAFTNAGMQAVALSLIEVGGPVDPSAVGQAWETLPSFDAVMFVSGNAVDHFFALKPSLSPVFTASSAIKTRAYVTGPGSRSALLRHGVEESLIDAPDANAGQFDSEALWALVGKQVQAGMRVLIVRGVGEDGLSAAGIGRDWFARQVTLQGAEVQFVVAYQRRCPVLSAADLALARTAASDGSVWVFSSSEAIANLQGLLPNQSWALAKAVATHPRIAQAARQAGFGVVCESRPVLAAVVASIESMQ